MENFIQTDFNVKKIVLACDVVGKSATTVHKNRSAYGLVYILNKSIYHFDDGVKITVYPNDLLFLPKGCSYTVELISLGSYFAINFECNEDVTLSPFKYKLKNQALLEAFKKIKSVWEKKMTSYQLKCKAELYNLLYTLQKEYYQDYLSKSKYDLILPAVEYIHQNYFNKPITVKNLAKKCMITPEYFRKIFKYFLGVSPLNYVNDLKIKRAKELIKSGLYTVSEVCFLSGFIDVSHFSRVFKKATGVSPSQYLKIVKALS